MIHFPLNKKKKKKDCGQATVKPQADKCFMWPGAFALLSQGKKTGATQNRPLPFRLPLFVCILHLPTAVKLVPVGGIKRFNEAV